MKIRLLILLSFCFALSASATGLLDTLPNPNKLFLGQSTDSRGLQTVGGAAPTFRPRNRFYSFTHRDTVAKVTWEWSGFTGKWNAYGDITQALPPVPVTSTYPGYDRRTAKWVDSDDSNEHIYNYVLSAWVPADGIHVSASTPTDVSSGGSNGAAVYTKSLWYDSANSLLKKFNGSSWDNVGSGGGGSDSIAVLRTDINNLQALSGRPDGSTNLGTMGQGTQYPDNITLKVFADSTDAKATRFEASRHAAATVLDGTTIDFTLSGQQITGEVKTNVLDSTHIKAGGIGNTDYAALSITGSKIAASTLDSTKIAAGGIGNTDLASAIVTWPKLAQAVKDSINASSGGSGDDVSAFPNAVNISGSEKVVLTNPDSLATFLQFSNQLMDSSLVGDYAKKIYAKTPGSTYDYQLGPTSCIRNDTIFTVFRSSPDHNVTANTTYGIRLAAFSAYTGRMYFEEWVEMDSLNSPSNNNGSVNNCTINDIGNGKFVITFVKVTQEGVPNASPRIKETFTKIRNANGTYATKKRVSGGYIPQTNSGWQSSGNIVIGSGGAWYLVVYGGSHPSNPNLNRINYDILLLRSSNQGTTWTQLTKIADGVTLSRQFEEPYLIQSKVKNADGTVSMGKWLCFIRIDGGGGALNTISLITTSGPTDTINWTTSLTLNRPVEKVNGAGYPIPFIPDTDPGKIVLMTRNKADSGLPTSARESESVYHISTNQGETWSGPYRLDYRNRAAQEKYMYGSLLEHRGSMVVVWAQERGGDSGTADIYMSRIPHQAIGSSITPRELEITKELPPAVATMPYYPNQSSFNWARGTGAMGLTPKTTTNTSGNFAFGHNALQKANGALDNFVMGDSAAQNCTGCRENIIMGNGTKMSSLGFVGFYNTIFNSSAGASLRSGYDNFIVGRAAMSADTSGSDCIALGRSTFPAKKSGANGIAIGLDAGPGIVAGTGTRFIGRTPSYGDLSELFAVGVGTGTTPSEVAFMFHRQSAYRLFAGGAGNANAVGTYLIAMGRESMLNVASGATENVGIGSRSLRGCTTCTNNVAIGSSNITNRGPLESITTQSFNVGVGNGALSRATTDENTAVGYFAANGQTTALRSAYFGYNAGSANVSGNYCLYLGSWTGHTNVDGVVSMSTGDSKLAFYSLPTQAVYNPRTTGAPTVSTGIAHDFPSTTGMARGPVMTTTQRNAIASPSEGGFLYNDDVDRYQYRTASAFLSFANLTEVVLKDGNTDAAALTMGTNDAFGVNIETNNTNRLRFDSGGRMTSGTMTDMNLTFSDSAKIAAANIYLAPTNSVNIVSANQNPIDVVGGFHSQSIFRATNASGNAGIILGNSADDNNTYNLYRVGDGNLMLSMSNDYPIAAEDDSIFHYNASTRVIDFRTSAIHLNGSPLAGTVGGAGQTNKIAYWTASGSIGFESSMTIDSTNNRLGLGTSTPDKTLGLGDGTDEFSISVASDKLTIWNDATTPVAKVTVDSTGAIDASSYKVNGTTLTDGLWTPTLTGVLNVGSSTAYECQWSRPTPNTIVFSGMIAVDPITTGSTIIGISLPVASDFTAFEKAGGTGHEPSGVGASVYADHTNDRLNFSFNSMGTTNLVFNFSGTYRIQ